MAALLTSVGDDKDKSAPVPGRMPAAGIKVLPPDVNDSVGDFASVGADIRSASRRSRMSARTSSRRS